MAAFVQWLYARRLRRVVLIAGLFPIPLLGILSAAVVVMTAYIRGPRQALFDCGVALAFIVCFGLFFGMDVPLLALSAMASWLIWIGLGSVAGRSQSLVLATQVAVVLTVAAFIAFLLWAGDPTAFWVNVLERLYADLAEQQIAVTADTEQQAMLMTGAVFAGVLAGTLLPLLLGVSWAAMLQAKDFGREFRSLNLGYVIGGMAAVAGVAGLLGVPLHGVLLVFGTAFVFQGVAVLSWWAHELKWPSAWWLALCVAPLFVSLFLVIELTILSALGFVDNWYGLRRKVDAMAD